MSCIDPTIGVWIEDFAGMPRSVGCSAASWIRCLVFRKFLVFHLVLQRRSGSLHCHGPLKETGAIRQNELVNLTLLLLKEKQSFGDQLRFAMRGIRVK